MVLVAASVPGALNTQITFNEQVVLRNNKASNTGSGQTQAVTSAAFNYPIMFSITPNYLGTNQNAALAQLYDTVTPMGTTILMRFPQDSFSGATGASNTTGIPTGTSSQLQATPRKGNVMIVAIWNSNDLTTWHAMGWQLTQDVATYTTAPSRDVAIFQDSLDTIEAYVRAKNGKVMPAMGNVKFDFRATESIATQVPVMDGNMGIAPPRPISIPCQQSPTSGVCVKWPVVGVCIDPLLAYQDYYDIAPFGWEFEMMVDAEYGMPKSF